MLDLIRRHGTLHGEESRLSLAQAIAEIRERRGAQGLARSSAVGRDVVNACLREIENRAAVLWSRTKEFSATLRLRETPEVGEDLKQIIRASIHLGDVRQHATQVRKWFPSAVEEVERGINRALRGIDAEVDGLILAIRSRSEAERAPGNPASTVFNIQNAGAVLTGPDATASVIQNFGQGERTALLDALEQVREALCCVDARADVQIREVIELTEECLTEVRKASPNRLRLRHAATGIAVAIQTLGAAQPAYQLLRSALLAMGISVP